MRKLGTIRMTQHTPIGDDQSATSRIYLTTIAYDEADFVTFKELQKLRSEGTPVNVVGYYEIVHPEIMGNYGGYLESNNRRFSQHGRGASGKGRFNHI